MRTRFQRLGPAHVAAQRRRMILLSGSSLLVSALAILGLIIWGQTTVDAREVVKQEPAAKQDQYLNTVVLLAPSSPVQRGTNLAKVVLREVYWPRDKIPEGAVRQRSDIRDKFAKVNLSANQPLVRSVLSRNPLSFGIVDLLPEGHRAVTIEVDATTGVEGWATPGAHVDVLLTYLDSKKGMNKTRVAVSDAVVLSYDRETKKMSNALRNSKLSSRNAATSRSSTVTLAVTLEDSLKIQTARAMGRITLALRGIGEDGRYVGSEEFSQSEFEGTDGRNDKKSSRWLGHASWNKGGQEKNFVLTADSNWWEEEVLD